MDRILGSLLLAGGLTASAVQAQVPCPAPGPGETALAAAAGSLGAGEACLLDSGLVGTDLKPDPSYDSMLTWTDSAVWDPLDRKVRWIGRQAGCGNTDRPFRHLIYDEATNSWSFGPLSDDFYPCGHGYDHNALDPADGTFYHRVFSSGFVSVFDGAIWSQTPDIPSNVTCCGGLTFFPELGGLVYVDITTVSLYAGGSWTELAESMDPPIGTIHNFSEYNPVHQEILFGGGNDAEGIVYRLHADSSITRAADAPLGLGTGSSGGGLVTVDPVGGDYLAVSRSTAAWYLFDPVGDNWQPTDQPPALSDPGRSIQTPVPDYGVILLVEDMGFDDTPARMWIYRHSGAPDTLPPAAPTALTAE